MAGTVKSRRLEGKFSSFWQVLILVSFFTIILSGCTTPKTDNGFSMPVPPEKKKAELRESLKRNFEDPQTHFLLGQLYHADKDWADAEYEYNLALRFDPVYRPAQAAMIKLQVDRGDNLKAQHYFEIYMNQAGDSPKKLVDLATNFQQQNVDTFALKAFQKALDIAPNSAMVHKYLGYFYLSRNDKEKAKEYFENSYRLDGNQPDVALELGKLGVPIVYDAAKARKSCRKKKSNSLNK